MTERLRSLLGDWLLPFGTLVFTCGLFLATGHTAYKTMVYLSLFAPALAAIVLSPRQAGQALFGNGLRLTLAVFVFWIASSASWAEHQSENNDFLKYAVFIQLFMLGLSRPLGPSDTRLHAVLRFGTVIATAGALWSLVYWYGVTKHPVQDRFNGLPPLYNPLVSAYFVGYFVAFLMSDFVAYRLPRRSLAFALPAVAVFVAFVWCTQARTPLLAWIVTALMLAVARRGNRRWMALIALASAVLMLVFSDALRERGFSWRPTIWQEVLHRVAAHPWIGHGLGNELLIVLPDTRHYFDTHNMHLATLYYGGLVGAVLWVMLLVLAFRAAWQRRQTPEGLLVLGLLVYGMVSCSFDGGYLIERPRENWFTLWLPLALAARLLDVPRKGALS